MNSKANQGVHNNNRREVDSLIILTPREIWLERNRRVFDKAVMIPTLVIGRIKANFERLRKAREIACARESFSDYCV